MKLNKTDLHMHSIYSDGSNTPEELIERSLNEQTTTIALTDHDIIEGSKEIIRINNGRAYIYSGVELTIKANKGRFHLLGLNIDLDNIELNEELRKQKEAGLYNIMLYIEVLKKDFGIIIPQEEIDNLYKIPGNVGRPQLALLLIKLGYCKEVEECFKKYLIHAYDKVRSVKKGITAEQGIELITNAGGVPIIAHPNSLKLAYKELKDYIIYLKSIGLQGLETEHPNLSMEERYVYHEFCKELDFLESGGTDYHGIDVKPDIEIGSGRNGNIYIPEHSLSLTKQIKSRYM